MAQSEPGNSNGSGNPFTEEDIETNENLESVTVDPNGNGKEPGIES